MTSLDLNDLAVYPKRTNRSQVTMASLARYYENFLYPSFYDFELSNGVSIRIDFDKENFCHLVGIGQIADKHFKKNDNRMFLHKGKRGFNRAKNGKLEFSYLKNLHQHEYAYHEKHKFFHFHFLHRMMESGNLKVIKYSPPSGNNSSITCDFMFHDKYDNALLHLGVEKNNNNPRFFPKTFFARYYSENHVDKYIYQQTEISINGLTKEVRNP